MIMLQCKRALELELAYGTHGIVQYHVCTTSKIRLQVIASLWEGNTITSARRRRTPLEKAEKGCSVTGN